MKKNLIIFFTTLIVVVSCKKYDDSVLRNQLKELQQSMDSIGTNAQKEFNITFSTGSLTPSFNKNTYAGYSVSSLNTKFSFTITVTAPNSTPIFINGIQAKANTPFEMKLDKLEWDGYISIKINDQEYRVKHIPDEFPRYTAFSNNPSIGDIYLTPGVVTILSNKGALLYYRMGQYTNFKKVYTPSMQIRYVVMRVDNVLLNTPNALGTIIIMDDHFNVIKEVRSISPSNEVNYWDEGHDFIFIDDNHYIFSMYTPMTVNNVPSSLISNPLKNGYGTQVVTAHLQEVKDDQIVWEWKSTDYPNFYASSMEILDFTNNGANFADYMHFNSVTIDPQDNHLILSLRNQWAIVKINRNTGALMWTLSGKNDDFGLTSAQSLKGQHHALVFVNPDGTKTITAFDNRTGEALSRVVEYTINETTKTLLNFSTLDGPYHGEYMGSAQRLANGRYFIGWGGGVATNFSYSATEISRDGSQIFFNLLLPPNVYSYRALKFE